MFFSKTANRNAVMSGVCLLTTACGEPNMQVPERSVQPPAPALSQSAEPTLTKPPATTTSGEINPPASGTETLSESTPIREQIMLVLDSSGSMWGQIDGEPKRDIAQTAIGTMLTELPSNAELGLVAYGHRRKGDCSDIEVIAQPHKDSSSAIEAKVKNLKALGKTPLTAAVESAANELALEDAKTTIILVTDGIETCDADPCALGRKLESKGIDFTAHVIGFGLTGDEGRQVSCLADETGGLYIEARNSGELGEALGTVNDDISAELPIEKPGPATVSVSAGDIIAGSKFEVAWIGPQNSLDSLQVRSTDGDTKYSRTYIYRDEDTSPALVTAPEIAGTYQLHYETRSGTSLASDQFTAVKASASVDAPDNDVIGNTRIKVSYTGPENEFDLIAIVDPGDNTQTLSRIYVKQSKDKQSVTLSAPTEPGEYTVEYQTRDHKALASDRITVVAPNAWIKAPDHPIVAGSRFETGVSGNAGDADRLIIPNPENARKPFDKGFIKRAKDGILKLMAPQEAGTYALQYVTREGEVLAEGKFTAVPPDPALTPQKSILTISERFDVGLSGRHGDFDQVVITTADYSGKPLFKRYVKQAEDNLLTLTAPKTAGDYVIQYRTRDDEVLSEVSVRVKP